MNQVQHSSPNFCSQCGTKLPVTAHFCPQCGVKVGSEATQSLETPKIRTSPVRTSGLVSLVIISLVVWGAGWSFQSWKAGKRPTVSYEEMMAKSDEAENDPSIQALKERAKARPEDLTVQRELAKVLFDKLRSLEQPSQRLVFDTIDAMREILRQEPNDRYALLGMADISFNQQVFPKAVEFFEKYLTLEPKDHDARARYASALTFNGNPNAAETQLKQVLAEDPDNFHASAYLSITYAQMGEREKALAVGEKALSHAPSEDAKERFSGFLDSVRSARSQDLKTQGAPKQAPGSGKDSSQKEEPLKAPSTGLEAVSDFVRANQVAGPKFVEAKILNGNTIALVFDNFPMDQMPPFVKTKFTSGIKEKVIQASISGISSVQFLDRASGKVMETLALGGKG